jgi:hypothetical protein
MDNLINGNGSTPDFVDQWGANAVANQSAADVADNGNIATGKAPSWYQTLTGVVQGGLAVANAVVPLTQSGSTTAPSTKEVQTTKQPAPASSSLTSKLPWLIGGVVAVVAVLFFVFRRK